MKKKLPYNGSYDSSYYINPFIVAAFVMHAWTMGFILFLVAASTDILDGLLARWYNEKTFLGAFLDPIADKILIVSCFFTLALVQSPLFSIPWWFVAIIAIKELIVLGGSWFIVYHEGQLDIVPRLLGKYAMFAQVVFIIWVFVCYFFDLHPIKTYYAVIVLLIILVIAALLDYIRLGLRYLNLI